MDPDEDTQEHEIIFGDDDGSDDAFDAEDDER